MVLAEDHINHLFAIYDMVVVEDHINQLFAIFVFMTAFTTAFYAFVSCGCTNLMLVGPI